MSRLLPRRRLVVLLAAGVLAVAGCSSTTTSTETADATTGTDAADTATSAADSVEMDDAWVKAADEGMSAAFGQLVNSSDQDVTVTSATTPTSTSVELHETVANATGEMVMQQVDGGFVIPAGTTLTLEPGGNHLMLMDLTGPVRAGDEVSFALTFSDGSTFEFTAPAKDYAGANETYEGDSGMDMGGTSTAGSASGSASVGEAAN